jgi:hypothetical protein
MRCITLISQLICPIIVGAVEWSAQALLNVNVFGMPFNFPNSDSVEPARSQKQLRQLPKVTICHERPVSTWPERWGRKDALDASNAIGTVRGYVQTSRNTQGKDNSHEFRSGGGAELPRYGRKRHSM